MEVMTKVLNVLTIVNLVAAWLYLTATFAPILAPGATVAMACTVTMLAVVGIHKGVVQEGRY